MADRWIGRDAGKSVAAPTFDPRHQVAQGAWFTRLFVRCRDSKKCIAQGPLHHVALGLAFLLFENEQWFFVLRVERSHFLFQQTDLGVLAAEAEHGGSGDVRAVDVSGQQSAQGLCILARAAAAKSMLKKFDAIDVGKHPCSPVVYRFL